jgi:ABC-type nitrate/sulfonate/bicarbonate transport system substrate-binding protein
MMSTNRFVKTIKRAIALVVLAGCGSAASTAVMAGDRYVPAPAEPGTALPADHVKFGMRPFADNTFYIIAMKKGWFKDVGISIDPAPEGLKVNDTNATALLLNGQLDVISENCPNMLPTYKSARTLKCVGFTDNFLGNAILANPKLHLKSFKQYIAEGMPFEAALHAALAPMQGKTLIGPPQVTDRPFEILASSMAKVNWNLQVLDDSKAVVLARAGRVDFVNPDGAPIVYSLEKAGWTDILDVGDLNKYAPAGPGSPVEHLVTVVGVGANGNFVNSHPNAMLRFMSVVWRTIDGVKKDPSLYALQAPYLNSVAGTSLNGKDIEDAVAKLHPFSPFEYGATYFTDTQNVYYYKSAWSAIISDIADSGVIDKGSVTPEDIVWAGPIWQQMKDYQVRTDTLFKSLDGQTLSADKTALLKQAHQYYTWFDFLDAYRFALAASGKA